MKNQNKNANASHHTAQGIEKEFAATIIVDWKKGSFRVTKKRPTPGKIKPSEIPIEFKLKAIIPETPIYKASGEIKIDFPKVKEIMVDSMNAENEDEENKS